MFDFFDLGSTATEGTRGMRIVGAVVGAIIGGLLGGVFGALNGGVFYTVGYGVIGALIGAGLGALFAGFVFLGLLIVAAIAIAIGYQWLRGEL